MGHDPVKNAQMTTPTSKRASRADRPLHRFALRMTQPEEMKTNAYVYGVEKLNGHDAWALFKACAAGDMPKVKALLAKDRRLVNAQFWYQFPIHMAVREGHAEIVKLLLDQGADPGQSRLPTIPGISCFSPPKSAGIARSRQCSSGR